MQLIWSYLESPKDSTKKLVRTNENPNGAPTTHEAKDVELINFNQEVKDDAEVVAVIEPTVEVTEEQVVDQTTKDKEQKKKAYRVCDKLFSGAP